MKRHFGLFSLLLAVALYFCFNLVAYAQNSTQSNAPTNPSTSIPGKSHMRAGAIGLQEAQDFEKASRKQLQESNNLRKKLLQARRQESTQTSAQTINSQHIEALQQQGNLLRNQSNARHAEAMQQFTLGLQSLWPDWIKTQKYFSAASLVKDANALTIQAHNTPERSVHPGMEMTAPPIQTNSTDSMSLLINSAPLQKPQMELDQSIFQLSRDGHYIGHIESQTAASNKPHEIPINEIHRWRLVLSDLQGNAIENAEIQFLGHMPGHVHGLPTQPKITGELAPGVYEVSGVKFQMQGWWVIDFDITANGVNDILRFNLVL